MDVRSNELGLVFKRNGNAPRVCFKCGTDRYVEPRTIDFVVDGQADAIERVPLCTGCYTMHHAAKPQPAGRALLIAGMIVIVIGWLLALTDLVLVVSMIFELVGIVLVIAGAAVRFLMGPKPGTSPDRLNVVDASDTDIVFETTPEVARAVMAAAQAE